MRISSVLLPLVAATMLITGCGDKTPATNAVTQAEAALETARPNASMYAPQELAAADATLASMKSNLAKEDYRKVVADVPKFNAEVKTLQETVVSKQTMAVAAQNEWETLSKEVPLTVEAIQARVTTLTGSKLPKEVTKENFDAAKTDLETLKTTWAEATAAAAAGNSTEAADKGRTVQAKAEELKTELGMNPAALAAAVPAAPAG